MRFLEVQDERVRESYRSLAGATTDRILAEGHLLTVMQLTNEDLCHAQVLLVCLKFGRAKWTLWVSKVPLTGGRKHPSTLPSPMS
eukprot:6487761-Amphidinium_carterae.1